MFRIATIVIVLLALFGPQSFGSEATLKARATLVRLPRSPVCLKEVNYTMAGFKVVKVLSGKLESKTLLALHRCPEQGRRFLNLGQAGALRLGQTYEMTLRPLSKRNKSWVDPFEPEEPRFEALQTDAVNWPPHVAVTAEGGVGVFHRFDFDATKVSIGHRADADVLLHHRTVAPRHLLLDVAGDQVFAIPQRSAKTSLNGRPLLKPTAVSRRDRLKVGPFTLAVRLYDTPPER